MTNAYNFPCVSCDEELTYVGSDFDAEALCPTCGVVSICPSELWDSEAAERRMDSDRDDRVAGDE